MALTTSAQTEPAPESRQRLLRQILISDSPAGAQRLSYRPNAGFVVVAEALKTFNATELAKHLAAAEGHVIDKPLLEAIAQVISTYAKQHGYLIFELNIPDQNISDGALRFAVVPGKFREIKFVGNRWSSDSQLRGDLHVDRGEIIRFNDLENTLSWINDSNPFRRVQVHVEQVPNSNEADLVIGVQERLPLRIVMGFDDAGNPVLGRNHYTFAATYANLWGLDHQFTYQYITTSRGQNFIGHTFSYRAPLPWHHYLQLSGSYLRARPTLLSGLFNQDAKNLGGDLRYTIPLQRGDNPSEIYGNLSFKQSNNNLLYGGVNVQNTETDVFDFSLGASKLRRDSLGAWVVGVNLTASPGHLDARNGDVAFSNARIGAKSRYVYGSISFQRAQRLDRGWELNLRGNVQAADSNLLSSEQLTVGGASTVRGFEENVFAGDEGFVFNNDLLGPIWRRRVSFRGKELVPLDTRLLAFYDVAQVRNKHAFAYDPNFVPMASTGVGVRMSWATAFSLSADYGWQITHLPYAVTEHGRGHVKVTLAY